MRERIQVLLDQLRLQGMAACLEDVLTNAEKKGTATHDVLIELLESEYPLIPSRTLCQFRTFSAQEPAGFFLFCRTVPVFPRFL